MLLDGIAVVKNIRRVLEVRPAAVDAPHAGKVNAMLSTDAGKVAHTRPGSILRVGLHAIYHIYIWCAYLVDGRNLYDAFAGRIGDAIDAGQHVALRDVRDIAHEVGEGNPVQAVFAVGKVANARFVHAELVLFDNIVIVLRRGHTAETLHHQNIAAAERIVEHALLGVEVKPALHRVVVVHLHHAGEDDIVVLSPKLRDDKLVCP